MSIELGIMKAKIELLEREISIMISEFVKDYEPESIGVTVGRLAYEQLAAEKNLLSKNVPVKVRVEF